MNRTAYLLRPRSYGWQSYPSRIVHIDMTVEHNGKALGGHNVQVVVGAPDRVRRGLDEDVVLTLESGWWVTLRNQFALAPCVAIEILDSVRNALSEITAEAAEAEGEAAEHLRQKLVSTAFKATGPDYWP